MHSYLNDYIVFSKGAYICFTFLYLNINHIQRVYGFLILDTQHGVYSLTLYQSEH